jgi:hypothetical protein
MCGGKLARARCRPCQKDTPAPGGPAWRRWTRGIDRVVRARLDGAGLGRLWAPTWEALLLDGVVPPEAAPLVADIARLPFSSKRYQRVIDRALLHSQIETMLSRAGLPNGERGGWVASNVAMAAAERIQAQRDRVAAGEIFERVHDAEIVHEAVLEHELRVALRRKGLRGARLEQAVAARVAEEMQAVRGSYGRPSDEYPREMRIELVLPRVAAPTPLRIEDEELAVTEAAEDEAAGAPRRGRAA